MAQARPLPEQDEHSDEQTLETWVISQAQRDAEAMAALRRPVPGSVSHAEPGKPTGLGARKVRCATSVADAVIEDRR